MDQKQFETTLADADTKLRRLRVLYDQWFMGIERVEPQSARNEVERLLSLLRGVHIRNTALRFRLNQLLQRFTAYSTYWKRVTRQIEEGTYKRDVLRARKMRQQAEVERPARAREVYEVDLDSEFEVDVDAALDAVMNAPPPAGKGSVPPPAPDARGISAFAMPNTESTEPNRAFPAPRATPTPIKTPPPAVRAPRASAPRPPKAPPPASSQALSDEQIRSIYNRYVAARRDNSERTDNVKIETIAKSVRGILPKLSQKHAGKQIDFEVVVRNGKVALKPVPK